MIAGLVPEILKRRETCEFHHREVTIMLLELTSFCVKFLFKLVGAAVNTAIKIFG